jgi:NAD(P)H-dependent FMN reductase
MKIAILIGSSRVGRQSHKIAYYLENQFINRGVVVDLIDLGKTPTVTAGLVEPVEVDWDELSDTSARVQQADALIFVTPEYHGSFSGVLKNTLDNMGREFYRKPIGAVTVSSGKMGGLCAVAQLQHVILSLGAFALPSKLLVPDVQTSFDDSFQLLNERTLRSAEKFIEDYLWLAEAVCDRKHKERSLQLKPSL